MTTNKRSIIQVFVAGSFIQLCSMGVSWAQDSEGTVPTTTTAQANGPGTNMAGKLGIGVGGFVTATPAAEVTYWLSEDLGILVDAQVRYFDPDDDAIEETTLFLLGGGLIYNFYQADSLRFEGFATVALGLGDASGVAFGGGFRPEYFLTNNFSLHFQVGLIAGVGYNPGAGTSEATVINLGTGSLVGDAGFTFYF